MGLEQRSTIALLIVFLNSSVCLSVRSSLRSAMSQHSFENYKTAYGRTYSLDSEEHSMREELFRQRLAEISNHNAQGLSWKLGVNHFTDRTPEELDMLNGHRPRPSMASVDSSFLEMDGGEASCAAHNMSCADAKASCCSGLLCGTQGQCVPTRIEIEFDWAPKLKTAHKIVEQGSCGSCWAVAAAAVLQLHAEIVSEGRFQKVLSPQSMLACSPNPLECGGKGGCKGATAELAFEWLRSRGDAGGVLPVDQMEYTAKDGSGSCAYEGSALLEAKQPQAISITGWKKVKDNDAQELMNALVTAGPVVSSIAANSLFGYSEGVIESCSDNVVNHAVTLIGYGKDSNHDMHYWNVRNSWGEGWGEHGFFRLVRSAPGAAEKCGWDNKPEDGVVCKDKVGGHYPTRQWVCGECGFLIDSAYPVGTSVPLSLLETSTQQDSKEEDAWNNAETMRNNAWCQTQCQHFAMKALSAHFGGADFGDSQGSCSEACDKHVPVA